MEDALPRDLTVTETTVRSAARGDEAAFARLVAAHHAAMARVAYVICGDPEATRDAAQSAWTIAWRRIGSLRDSSQVRAWLIAIAANEARQVVRRRRRERVVDISADVRIEDRPDPGDEIELIDLRRVIHGLKDDDRTLLALRYAAGLDSVEIADLLGLSPSGVRSRLARLLERLRADLALEPETDA
jgi:RNA polymerase sigma factor (sigma-70 family)